MISPRIAVGGFFIECNHFAGIPADVDAFERGGLFRDDELLNQQSGTLGGILQTLATAGSQVLPLIAASACSSGPVTDSCYDKLKQEIISRLIASLPVDGVLLALHGAAVSESCLDLEGDLLSAVREIVGPDVPLVATLDLHAHVTELMVESADALVAWETYPHADAYETGERSAQLLTKIVDGSCAPTMVMAKVPLLCSAIHGSTHGDDPFAIVMRFTKSFERESDVLSASTFLVHPYLDLPGMGGGGLVITDGRPELAERLARDIAELYWSKRGELEPTVRAPDEAIRLGQKALFRGREERLAALKGRLPRTETCHEFPNVALDRTLDTRPILLIEAADCCGGGAAGDSVATLKALLNQTTDEICYVPVVDPEAAEICHKVDVGQRVSVSLGHQLDPQWGTPVPVTGDVVRLTDGRFRYTGGIWNGQFGEMGPTAVLRIGAVHVMISSFPTYDWADEQYRSVGLEIERAEFVVFKNPMNHRLVMSHVAREILILETAGPTPATLRGRELSRMQRPYFPHDLDIPGLEPTFLRSRTASVSSCENQNRRHEHSR